jgi:hypothetical protein
MSIDSNQGRIGSLWWINSDQTPRTEFVPVTLGVVDTGMVVKSRVVRWGTCGIGSKVRIVMEALDV